MLSRLQPVLRRFAASVQRFSANSQAGVAVFFAFSFVPLAIGVGAAVDYTYASKVKARLDAAADLAALNGVKTSNVMPTAAAAKAAAIASFQTNIGTLDRATLTSSAITVTDDGLGRTSTVTYSAQVQTSLMALVGVNSIAISGSVKANSNLPTYIDFHILLDNTPSMGIGATPTDVSTMVANTSDKCGFACHDLSDPSGNYYKLAKKLGVTLRIDVVRQATQSLMDTAAATERVNDQFRTQLYTFGSSCTVPGYTLINALTANLSQAKSAAANIDLMTIPNQGYNNDQCTDFNGALSAVNLSIATPGDGSTAATPQKVMFFVSDGVADAYYPTTCTKPTTGGRCQEPINTATCTAIKARGIRIAVLYTTYLPLTTNAWYNTWIKPFQSEIATRMEACASPGLYFEVSPTQGIADAMNALFQKAVATARLTQ
ncbi:pilus assembly protein [Phreatobacter aquaticus]|uniref:Pilus assembly protein n=2 Tax=Phreatobacter aquaticus TaxID=2570229 RepID=A0A4D7QM23_9HYPH|nr:pilus assembly protein [Phreatobacter aquaticus]